MTNDKWMPIETAPKDKRVLIWTGHERYVAHWAKNLITNDEAWVIAGFGDQGNQIIAQNPTHWAHLIDSPGGESAIG